METCSATGKIRFVTASRAYRAVAWFRRRNFGSLRRVYRCPSCHGYHRAH